MSKQITFLSIADVLQLHTDTLQHEGGGQGTRDRGLLDSAVMMAQQQFAGEYLHPSIPAMAAAYLFHICNNHPFVDGNKRCAALASLVFLYINDVEKLPEPNELEEITLQVAAGDMGKQELIEWFERALKKN